MHVHVCYMHLDQVSTTTSNVLLVLIAGHNTNVTAHGNPLNVKMKFDSLYNRANYLPSWRQIASFASETSRCIDNHATSKENKKRLSNAKGVVMYAYSISVYYA